MEVLSEGRLVHYVYYNQKHLSAVVLAVPSAEQSEKPLRLDLAIFTSLRNLGQHRPAQNLKFFGIEAYDQSVLLMNLGLMIRDGELQFHSRIPFCQAKTPGTWHWIEV